jgi:hypothetical protein
MENCDCDAIINADGQSLPPLEIPLSPAEEYIFILSDLVSNLSTDCPECRGDQITRAMHACVFIQHELVQLLAEIIHHD